MALPTVVRRWAYTGALVGAGVSIAANILHSYVPPPGMPADWQPAPGAVFGAVFWPVALLVAVELFARWHPDVLRFKVLRWLGLVPVAVVAAVVSYRHMSGLLAFWHEDPVTVVIGPLAVDGIMVMAAGALIATSPATPNDQRNEQQPPVEVPTEPIVVKVARQTSQRRSPARDGDTAQAGRRVQTLVAAGLLPHPDELPCVDCGHERGDAERRHEYDHHKGYAPEHHEDVQAVCAPCHHARTRRDRPRRRRATTSLGSRLDAIREKRAADATVTQKRVAELTGIPMRTVARYWQQTAPSVNGARHDP